MHLKSPSGDLFSLTVLGYELPEEELGPTEDNPADDFSTGRFLVFAAYFYHRGDSWSATGPLGRTRELKRLSDWIASIVEGCCTVRGVYFTERDLELEWLPEQSRLVVHVFRNFLPKRCDADHIPIEFPVSVEDLRVVLDDLRGFQRRFPGRPLLPGCQTYEDD